MDDDPYAELFVLSEKEGVVGRCDVTPTGIPYPVPLSIEAFMLSASDYSALK